MKIENKAEAWTIPLEALFPYVEKDNTSPSSDSISMNPVEVESMIYWCKEYPLSRTTSIKMGDYNEKFKCIVIMQYYGHNVWEGEGIN